MNLIVGIGALILASLIAHKVIKTMKLSLPGLIVLLFVLGFFVVAVMRIFQESLR